MSKLLYSLLFLSLLNLISPAQKLLFVYEHVRHGARGPIFHSSKKYIDQYGTDWGCSGELTWVGHRQHYVIGVRNRQRYSSLLDFNNYDPKQLEVKSTPVNRVVESIESELLAMFLPGTGKVLNDDEKKFAVPPGAEKLPPEVMKEISELKDNAVANRNTMIPIKIEGYRKLDANNCPYFPTHMAKHEKQVEKQIIAPFLNDFDKRYGNQLAKYFNESSHSFMHNLGNICGKTENFIANIYNGNKLKDFFDKTAINLNEYLPYCDKTKLLRLYHHDCDEKTGTMSSSYHMRNILNYMQNRIEHEDEINYAYPKMVMQGGHDTTVNTMQQFMKNAFGVEIINVKFAGNLFFELYKDTETGKYSVKYIVDMEEKFTMDYEDFKLLVEKKLVSEDEIHEWCHKKGDEVYENYYKDSEYLTEDEDDLRHQQGEIRYFKVGYGEDIVKKDYRNVYLCVMTGLGALIFALILVLARFIWLYKKNEKVKVDRLVDRYTI